MPFEERYHTNLRSRSTGELSLAAVLLVCSRITPKLFPADSPGFLYDFVVYPFNLLAPTLVSGFGDHQTLLQSVGWSALINAFAIPGAILGAFLVDIIGRRQTYTLGFAVVAVLGFVIGGARYPLSNIFPLFVVLFGLLQSFLSVGPGDCNFLVASESFPTALRGHFLGFAAAVGKAGAAIGTTVLTQVLAGYEDKVRGQQVLFLIASAICTVGALVVWFMIPNVSFELSVVLHEGVLADFRSIMRRWSRKMLNLRLTWKKMAGTLLIWGFELEGSFEPIRTVN